MSPPQRIEVWESGGEWFATEHQALWAEMQSIASEVDQLTDLEPTGPRVGRLKELAVELERLCSSFLMTEQRR